MNGWGFVAKQKIPPDLFDFVFNVFRSFYLSKSVPKHYVSDNLPRSYGRFNVPNHASFPPLLHNVSWRKRTVRALSSRKSMSEFVLQEVFHVYLNKFENAVTHLFLMIFGNN